MHVLVQALCQYMVYMTKIRQLFVMPATNVVKFAGILDLGKEKVIAIIFN